MLLSCHCDVTTPKAKWDGPKAPAQGIFYSETKMHSQAITVISYVKIY